MERNMDYRITRATPDDADVETFIHEHFWPEMPLVQAFGLEGGMPPSSPVPSVFNLKAVDEQGNIIGVAVNMFNFTLDTNQESPPAVKQMVELLLFTEREAKLSRLPEKTIELRRLSVRKEWRGKGVGRRLAEESVREARSLGYAGIKICCTSEFTAKLARSLGWREVYRLTYADYPALSGNEVDIMPTPPHNHLYYFYTDL